MSEREARFTYEFSHEFEEGPSGPARSYWIVRGPGMASALPPVCLHHRRDLNGPLAMQQLCYALDKAFDEGAKAKAAEVRRVIGA